jgi:uncharacterized protein YuzE
MKVAYDKETDALYLRLSSARIVESEEVRPGLVLDFDAEGHIVAIELLDAAKQVPPDALASSAAE